MRSWPAPPVYRGQFWIPASGTFAMLFLSVRLGFPTPFSPDRRQPTLSRCHYVPDQVMRQELFRGDCVARGSREDQVILSRRQEEGQGLREESCAVKVGVDYQDRFACGCPWCAYGEQQQNSKVISWSLPRCEALAHAEMSREHATVQDKKLRAGNVLSPQEMLAD